MQFINKSLATSLKHFKDEDMISTLLFCLHYQTALYILSRCAVMPPVFHYRDVIVTVQSRTLGGDKVLQCIEV